MSNFIKKKLSVLNNKIINISDKFPILSFFTGGGFLDIGFIQAGFNVVWTNESNHVFADLYEYGMNSWLESNNSKKVLISDRRSIEKIYVPDIIEKAFVKKKPKFFGVIGGPPCPDFSVGGKNKGYKGSNGKLSKTYISRICKLKPTFFVFENVPGLYDTKDHRKFLKTFEKRLEKNGYCLDMNILSALSLGLPQDRDRFILIGIKKAIARKFSGVNLKVTDRKWFPWPVDKKFTGAKTKYEWPTIANERNKVLRPKKIPKELTVKYHFDKISNLGLDNQNDTFKPKSKKFQQIKEGDTYRKSFKKLHRFRYSPTVCYGNNEVHLHPWLKRRLSVREAMVLQGIPNTYSLPENATLTSKFKVVSNGVPVPVSNAVAQQIIGFLSGKYYIKPKTNDA
jgi:DNA (cytosine-5)-methyltransferase 1